MGRCTAANVVVPSRDQLKVALASCCGDEEEVIASLVRPLFLSNIYDGNGSGDARVPQLKSLQLNEELTALLTDESIPRDVSLLLS